MINKHRSSTKPLARKWHLFLSVSLSPHHQLLSLLWSFVFSIFYPFLSRFLLLCICYLTPFLKTFILSHLLYPLLLTILFYSSPSHIFLSYLLYNSFLLTISFITILLLLLSAFTFVAYFPLTSYNNSLFLFFSTSSLPPFIRKFFLYIPVF